MAKKTNENTNLRNYLLGNINIAAEREKIEKRIMLDDEFFEELTLKEEELIQDYADKELTSSEKKSFEKHFLISDERRRKVKFAVALRKYINEQEKADKPETNVIEKKNFWLKFKSLFLSPLPVASGFLLLIFASFLVWYLYLSPSGSDRAMASISKAYRFGRPIESRITDFTYAPFSKLRSETENKIDLNERNLAERILLDEITQKPTAENIHTAGRLHLVKKEFDKAIEEFEKAQQSAPQNAEIFNDLGVALLEQSQITAQDANGKSLELKVKALENFEKAIELKPDMLEAHFNRALCLQAMFHSSQAQEAWQEYLKLDSNSRWAEEARRNLKLLELDKPESKTAQQVIQDFLTSYRENDDESAYQIVSHNREMITGKLVPQQLAFLFLEKESPEKQEYLKALKYVGELEKKKSGDPFFAELAKYYSFASEENLGTLSQAQALIKKGYELCEKEEYQAASDVFIKARDIFDKIGNSWERQISDYWIAYCDFNNGKVEESSQRLIEVVKHCQKENYKWLLSQAAYWLAVNNQTAQEISKAFYYIELSLKFSKETFDLYNTQKTHSFLAEIHISVKQYQKSLANIEQALILADSPDSSLRQRWRDFDRAAQLFFKMKLYRTAIAFEKEALNLNKTKIENSSFERISSARLSVFFGTLKKYEQAFEFAEKGRQAAEKMKEEASRKKGVAFAFLQMADLQFEKGDYQEALANYNAAIELYISMKFQPYQYEAEKGRLLCYLADNNNQAAQTALTEVLRLFEKYRTQIVEGASRDSFFNDEQNVYDLAIDYEYRLGNDERAFEFAESSRSRSLLDWQKNGGEIKFVRGEPQVVFAENTVVEPLLLADIRAKMPVQAQLIQYAVLHDKVLIWLITKESFQAFSYKIPIEDLTEKTTSFIAAIKNREAAKQADLARALYQILFSQVEKHLDSDKDIFLIPDKILFHLPFVALISDKTGNFLVADYKLSSSPSANAFLVASENASKRNQSEEESVLSIGNPAFDRKEFPNFNDLPGAEKEARKIAAFYSNPPLLLLGKNATKAKLIEQLPQADVVHFAGHYTTNEFSPLSSGFLIAGIGKDSHLANYELLEAEKLDKPKLIVLAACQTGIEKYYEGEGMIGAGRTFLALGVPLVVASQWEVDSDATAELMQKLHFYRRVEKLSTASALRRAQLEMLNNSVFREPFYWAGFITLGGYAQF